MTEKKLMEAVVSMPSPNTQWEEILIREHRTPLRKKHPILRPAAIIFVLLLVFPLSAGAYRYSQIQRSMWVTQNYSNLVMPVDNAWGKVQKLLVDLDVQLPDTLMGTPFECGRKFSVVPSDTPLLEAMFTDFYTPLDIHYSHVTFTDEIGNFERLKDITVGIGSTQQQYWKHYFGVSEDGTFFPEATHIEVYQGIELRGYSRSIEDTSNQESFVIHAVQWIDNENNLCFNISVARTDSVEFLMDCAKEIIDLNH